MRELVDRSRWIKPSDFWKEGTYHPSPRFANCCLIILWPPAGADGVALARRAARLLEERNGLMLDWAAGIRASGAVWLLIKTRALDVEASRFVRFRPSPEDLEALRGLAAPVPRKQFLERTRVRERR
ncbi:MAG: hypothetical protein ACPLTR_08500 [Thermacetogeniaceae bacterium]